MINKTLSCIKGSRLEIVGFTVGLVTLAFELTASRIVAPYLGSTIYTWTSVIGVILAALAVGYSWGGVLSDSRKKIDDVVLLLLSAAAVIVVANMVKEGVLSAVSTTHMALQLQALLGSVFLFAAPTVLMGTIMPYLARLNITDLKTSGHKLSRIDAASTVGSLVGTFLTGYVLFGFIGTRYLLTFSALVLLLISFLLPSKAYLRLRVALIGIILLLGLSVSPPLLTGFVTDIDTPYNRVIVRDIPFEGQTLRVLQTDSQGIQSGVFPGMGNFVLALPYTRAFAYVAELKQDTRKYLVVGGGAFTVPEYLARISPNATVDAVEIDNGLVAISERYFDFSPLGNIHVIDADGRQFLNVTKERYDIVYLDAFNSIVPPFQLMTEQAVGRVHDALTDGGIVAANLVSAPQGSSERLIRAAYSTFKEHFTDVTLYRVTPDADPTALQNSLLLASNRPIDRTALDRVAARYGEFRAMLGAKINVGYDPNFVLRDDFAPVERYSL